MDWNSSIFAERGACCPDDWNGVSLYRRKVTAASTGSALRRAKRALKAYPGKIVSEELEQESGGSGLRYSFVIRHRKVKHEVGVDAKTGEVLEDAVEGENPD